MRSLSTIGGLIGMVVLTGCTTMTDIAPGSSLADVQADYGKPSLTCEQSNGQLRLIWSQQPFGQYAWATTVDAQGKVGTVAQILQDQRFNQLNEGQWGPDRVTCEFGPPANVESVGMPSVRKTVWGYRYKQYGVWNSIMNVFFDPETMQVTGYYPTPDPMYEYDEWSMFY